MKSSSEVFAHYWSCILFDVADSCTEIMTKKSTLMNSNTTEADSLSRGRTAENGLHNRNMVRSCIETYLARALTYSSADNVEIQDLTPSPPSFSPDYFFPDSTTSI